MLAGFSFLQLHSLHAPIELLDQILAFKRDVNRALLVTGLTNDRVQIIRVWKWYRAEFQSVKSYGRSRLKCRVLMLGSVTIRIVGYCAVPNG